MDRRLHAALAAVSALVLAGAGVAQQAPGPDADRNPGRDSERLSRLFPSRVHTAIKAGFDPDDRTSAPNQGNDDGFTGTNHCESYRIDDHGTPVSILADFEGRAGVLGLFFRNFWSDAGGQPMLPGENNRTRMWVDGQLRTDMPLWDYFRNVNDPRGQVAPFCGPFTGNRSGGHLTHAQIR